MKKLMKSFDINILRMFLGVNRSVKDIRHKLRVNLRNCARKNLYSFLNFHEFTQMLEEKVLKRAANC